MDGYSTQDNFEKKIYPQKVQLSKMTSPGVCRSPLEERVFREYKNRFFLVFTPEPTFEAVLKEVPASTKQDSLSGIQRV